ncbi:MAG TPA: hypothetical protein VFN83_01570 [Gemmatimonadales bacterium]|nr:hypothetical protein [Gemmatimonadales bacterium]
MVRRSLALGLSCVVLGVPAGLQAQQVCGGVVQAPAEGGFASYLVSSPSGRTMTVRFAVVGAETREGTRNIWFETRAQEGTRPVVISQVLVPGFPYDPSALADAALQGPSGVPVQLTAQQLARSRRALPGLTKAVVDGCRAATLVGTETVTVPAGKYSAQHYRNALRGSDIWVSTAVPFGIVKMVDGTDKSRLELTAAGKNAKSSFLAKPQSQTPAH